MNFIDNMRSHYAAACIARAIDAKRKRRQIVHDQQWELHMYQLNLQILKVIKIELELKEIENGKDK